MTDPTPRAFCSWCGRRILAPCQVWQDPEGRIFKYHRACQRSASRHREIQRIEMEKLFK